MFKTYHETTTGRQVADSAALDERGQIRDGYTLRVHGMLMDGIPPGKHDAFAGGYSDAQLAQMDAYDSRISSAWRNPDQPFAVTKPVAVDPAKVTDAYERHDRWLADAWR